MKIGFRLDANEYVASGHMFRCVAVAKQIRMLQHEVLFFLAEEKNTELLIKENMPYIVINGHWDDFDQDISCMIQQVHQSRLDVLVVDSYKITGKFLSELNHEIPVFLFDDICTTRYAVSAVLHYSEWEGNEKIRDLYEHTDVKTISGLQYVPLREEFTEKVCFDKKKQILITTGGTDPYHISYQLVDKIFRTPEFDEYSVLIVCGINNKDYDILLEKQKKTPRVRVVRNASNMAQLMKESMFAVCAGGMTVYELCAVQCPAVAIAISDDQFFFLEEMHRLGVVLYAGDIRQIGENVYANVIECMKKLLVQNEIETIREKMYKLVDGQGAYRIAKEIIKCKKVCEDNN